MVCGGGGVLGDSGVFCGFWGILVGWGRCGGDSGGFWGILETMGDSSFSGDSGWILVYSGGILGILVDSGESEGDSGGFCGFWWILKD